MNRGCVPSTVLTSAQPAADLLPASNDPPTITVPSPPNSGLNIYLSQWPNNPPARSLPLFPRRPNTSPPSPPKTSTRSMSSAGLTVHCHQSTSSPRSSRSWSLLRHLKKDIARSVSHGHSRKYIRLSKTPESSSCTHHRRLAHRTGRRRRAASTGRWS